MLILYGLLATIAVGLLFSNTVTWISLTFTFLAIFVFVWRADRHFNSLIRPQI